MIADACNPDEDIDLSMDINAMGEINLSNPGEASWDAPHSYAPASKFLSSTPSTTYGGEQTPSAYVGNNANYGGQPTPSAYAGNYATYGGQQTPSAYAGNNATYGGQPINAAYGGQHTGNIPNLHMRGRTMRLTVGNEPLMVGNIPNLHMRGKMMRLTVGNTSHLHMLGTIHFLGVCPGGRGGSLFDRNGDSRCWDIDTYTDQGSSQQPSRNASKGSKPENGTVPYRNCSSRCGTRIKFCCAAIALPITLPLMIIYIHLSLVFFFQSPPIRIQTESLFSHCTDFLPSRHYCTYFHMTWHLSTLAMCLISSLLQGGYNLYTNGGLAAVCFAVARFFLRPPSWQRRAATQTRHYLI